MLEYLSNAISDLILHFGNYFLHPQHLPSQVLLVVSQIVRVFLQPPVKSLVVLDGHVHGFLELVQIVDEDDLDVVQIPLDLVMGVLVFAHNLIVHLQIRRDVIVYYAVLSLQVL